MEACAAPRLALVPGIVARLDSGALPKPACGEPAIAGATAAAALASALAGAAAFARHPALLALREHAEAAQEAQRAGQVRSALHRLSSILVLAALLCQRPQLLRGPEAELLSACAAAPASAPAPHDLQRLPLELTCACASEPLSAALLMLQDASRTGDAVAAPPSAGLHPSFTLAALCHLLSCPALCSDSEGGSISSSSSRGTTVSALSFSQAALLLNGSAKAPLLRSLLAHWHTAAGASKALLRLRVSDKEAPFDALLAALGGGGEGTSALPSWPCARPLHPCFAVALPQAAALAAEEADRDGRVDTEVISPSHSAVAGGEGATPVKAPPRPFLPATPSAVHVVLGGTCAAAGGLPSRRAARDILDDSSDEEGSSSSSSSSGGIALLGGSTAVGAFVEDKGGEGQGPRREFFHLCGRALVSDAGPWAPLSPLAYALRLVEQEEGAALALVMTSPSAPALPSSAFELEVRESGPQSPAKVLRVTSRAPQTGVLGLEEEEGASTLPHWLPPCLRASAHLHLAIRLPRTPCLVWSAGDGLHYLHPSTSTSTPSPSGALATAAAAAGWLCAAALVNDARLTPACLAPHIFSRLLLASAGSAAVMSDGVGAACLLPPSSLAAVDAAVALKHAPTDLQAVLQAAGLVVQAGLSLGEDGEGGSGGGSSVGVVHWSPAAPPAATAAVALAFAAHTAQEAHAQAESAHFTRGWRAGVAGGMQDVLAALRFSGADVAHALSSSSSGTGGGSTPPALPLQSLFRIQRPREFATPAGAPLERALWAVLQEWQRARPALLPLFLTFVTASPHPPPPGSALLRIELPYTPLSAKEHARLLRALPTAHTCTHTLELPNYYAALQRGVGEEEARALGEGVGAWAEVAGQGDAWARACAAVLAERLEVAVTEGGAAYGLT